MRTLRIYKILIPGLLVLVLVLLALQLKPVGGAHSQPASPDGLQIGSSAQGVTAIDMDGANKQMEIRADSIERDESGRIDLERIHELKLYREDMVPLVVEALSGNIDGPKGARTMTFTEGVTLDDPARDLKLRIPAHKTRAAKLLELSYRALLMKITDYGLWQDADNGPSAALHSSRPPAAGTSPPQSPDRPAPCIWTLLGALPCQCRSFVRAVGGAFQGSSGQGWRG